MTLDGQLIGQNMFMKAVIAADDGRSIPIMTMGPICIAPELKRKGYGKILLDYSLEKAKELLLNPDIPVGTVALKVGYGNYSYFSKLFKDVVGCTPNEYRKK